MQVIEKFIYHVISLLVEILSMTSQFNFPHTLSILLQFLQEWCTTAYTVAWKPSWTSCSSETCSCLLSVCFCSREIVWLVLVPSAVVLLEKKIIIILCSYSVDYNSLEDYILYYIFTVNNCYYILYYMIILLE